MSELAALLHPGPPAFHLTAADTTELGDATISLIGDRPAVAVRRVRGTRCRTTAGLFDELAAALQFPAYFGANWNALSDVLTDLRWLPAEAYLLVIEDADEFLAEAHEEMVAAGLTVLAAVAERVAPVPFQIVLQAPADGRISRALTANGTPFDVVGA